MDRLAIVHSRGLQKGEKYTMMKAVRRPSNEKKNK